MKKYPNSYILGSTFLQLLMILPGIKSKGNSTKAIAIMNEFGIATAVGQLAHSIRQLSPQSRIITFGRLSNQIPEFFRRYQLDAVVHSGDYEAGVAAYIAWLHGDRSDIPGVSVRREDTSWSVPTLGLFLEPEKWAFPDINEIPYDAYNHLYLNDSNKFCGIPERRELVVQIARGCPVNCQFCEVPRLQGLRERRRSVTSVLDYIDDCFAQSPFEYVSMYAPTFTLNYQWVESFCRGLLERGVSYPWKCTTTLFRLNRPLIESMAQSGCVRISVGLETLDPSKKVLPRVKQIDEVGFDEVATWCIEAGVELNCFIILGLPGQSIEGARFTLEKVQTIKHSVYQ